MSARDVTSDAQNDDKATPTLSDKIMVIDVSTTPDTLKESTLSNVKTALGIVAASDTVSGIVEIATAAETTTGTDATRAVSPDGLAGSDYGIKAIVVEVFGNATALTTGDGKRYFPVPASLAGFNLIRAHATLYAKSTSGTPTVQIARGRQASATSAHSFVDMLSTRITVDQDEYDSRTAATAPVVDTSNDDIASGDVLRVDVDVAGTAATGLWITFEFQKP